MNEHLSLYDLNTLVENTLTRTMGRCYWVEAELSDVMERNGHLFADLIQKDEGTNTPIARAQAKCWANTWYHLRRNFESITGQALRPGMKVLLSVYPKFHQAYGFSWIVADIDARFTLGDMARRRQEIIRQLKEEGVFDLQRELQLPMFCQRIAVISSPTAAGYGDFCSQLKDNDYGLKYNVTLFPATMQGEQVESSVIAALNNIFAVQDDYDCVVIIRGGGATTDMSGFDTLLLAENVANFPLPIITGIGHDRDECILDMVAYKALKTPTAVAAFLVGQLLRIDNQLDSIADSIVSVVQQRLERETLRLSNLSARIPILFSLIKTRQESRIDSSYQRIVNAVHNIIHSRQHQLELLDTRSSALDPNLVLQRGYSMTLCGGKVVKDASHIADGDVIETRLAKGSVFSTVNVIAE